MGLCQFPMPSVVHHLNCHFEEKTAEVRAPAAGAQAPSFSPCRRECSWLDFRIVVISAVTADV